MKDKTKKLIKNLFGSLAINDSAIEGAKTAPWWIAVILFVVGTFLPIIPIMVTNSKAYGASYLSSNVYGYEQRLAAGVLDLQEKGYTYKVENKQLVERIGDAVQETTWEENAEGVSKDETPVYTYYVVRDGVTEIGFEIYYSDRPVNKTTKSITALKKTIEERSYIQGTTNLYDSATNDKSSATYKVSYVLLYKDGMYSKVYVNKSTSAAATSASGMNWNNAKFDELLTNLATVENVEKNLYNDAYVNGVFNNFKVVNNNGYKDQKIKSFWLNSGLYYGIYIALGFFMGFMMWVLTRGKNNPNRGLNIFTAFKISWWIDLTPGILAMAIGFMWTQAAGLAYIVLIGIRTMWLSMRSLNPSPTQG